MVGNLKYFLGVDGGATRNEAVIVDEKRQVLGKGKGGGANYRVAGIAGLVENLKESISEAVGKAKIKPHFSFAVFGLAGCDSDYDQKILEDTVSKNFSEYFPSFLVVNDTRIALRSGTEDSFGVAVIAGTGSNTYGRNKRGEETRAGGLDYLLTDEGSAYDIGLRVLRTAVRSFDGRGDKSLLEKMVMEKLGISMMREAVGKVYKPSFDKAKVASFAPLAGEAASLGDKAATEILTTASSELFLGVKAVVERLGMENEAFDLVLVGSVFEDKTILDSFRKEVSEFTSGARLVFPNVSPACAAAFLALREYDKIQKGGR